jgi:hypothetical protein
MRDSAPTSGPDRADSTRTARATRRIAARGVCEDGAVRTQDAGRTAYYIQPGFYTANRGGSRALRAGCYRRFEEGSVCFVGDL